MPSISRLARTSIVVASVIASFACSNKEHPSSPLAPAPASIAAQTSTTITATVGSVVSPAPAVRVLSASGEPVPNVSVSFTVGEKSGTVGNPTVATDANGVATAAEWVLGSVAGADTLTASVTGVASPVVFTATAAAAPASALVALSSPSGPFAVATSVTPKPSVRVTDAYGNAISGASVAFSVQSGGGSAVGGSVTSDANGIASVGGWTLGTHSGTQTLRASLGSSATQDFNVTVVAGPPAQMLLVAGANQYGRVGTVLPLSPAVQVLDKYSNAVVGGSVTFVPVGASGSLSKSSTTTNGQGLATMAAWTLGAAEGVDSVYVSAAPGLWLPVYARVVPISQFNITLRYLTPATPTQQAAFQRAADRWRDIVIGDLKDVTMSLPANACGVNEPPLNETVDDLLIYVGLDSIDGPGNVLGAASPCYTRNSNGLPIIGFMHFDTADVAQLEANNQLDDVIRHEMGHVLGIGSLWQSFGLLTGAGTSDPFFTGTSARQGFSAIGGSAYVGNTVPVENVGGAGTAGSHWRESVLNSELMTGYISPPGTRMPLSLVTIGSLEDLGYTITPWGYDVFTFGVDLRSSVEAPARPLFELPPARVPIAIDDNGGIAAEARLSIRALRSGRRVDLARNAPRQLESVKSR